MSATNVTATTPEQLALAQSPPPCLIVTLALEQCPTMAIVADTSDDAARLAVWLRGRHDLAEAIRDAIERAAA